MSSRSIQPCRIKILTNNDYYQLNNKKNQYASHHKINPIIIQSSYSKPKKIQHYKWYINLTKILTLLIQVYYLCSIYIYSFYDLYYYLLFFISLIIHIHISRPSLKEIHNHSIFILLISHKYVDYCLVIFYSFTL
jgi:hypothetical protein